MELLQKATTEGVDLRGPLCNQFWRDANGGKSEAYKRGGRFEKQEFRKRWAAQKFEDMTKVREREDEWKQVDTSKGNMVSIKELVKKEGAQDAKKYIEKCAELGAPWIQWDPMWERYEVMVMERSHADVFTKAWRLKCQRTEGPAVITERPRNDHCSDPTKAKAVIPAAVNKRGPKAPRGLSRAARPRPQ